MKIVRKGQMISVKGGFKKVEDLKRELKEYGLRVRHYDIFPCETFFNDNTCAVNRFI